MISSPSIVASEHAVETRERYEASEWKHAGVQTKSEWLASKYVFDAC